MEIILSQMGGRANEELHNQFLSLLTPAKNNVIPVCKEIVPVTIRRNLSPSPDDEAFDARCRGRHVVIYLPSGLGIQPVAENIRHFSGSKITSNNHRMRTVTFFWPTKRVDHLSLNAYLSGLHRQGAKIEPGGEALLTL